MFKHILSKLFNRPTAADKRFWSAIGVLVAFAVIGAMWLLFSALK